MFTFLFLDVVIWKIQFLLAFLHFKVYSVQYNNICKTLNYLRNGMFYFQN